MFRIKLIKLICRHLPPLISHRIQAFLISNQKLEKSAFNFSAKSITGGILKGNLADFIASQFYFHGYFDWRNIVLVKHLIRNKAGNIIEVGSNIGTETISYCNLNPHKVFAFEPSEENFEKLEELKIKNEIENLCLSQLMISDEEGFSYFVKPSRNNSGTGFLSNKMVKNSSTLKVSYLDKEFQFINSCAVLVIDTEGYELKAIIGAQKLIEKFRPFLIFEVNPNLIWKRSGCSVGKVLNILEKKSYTCYSISKYSLVQVGKDDLEKKHNVNWIGIPNEYNYLSNGLSNRLLINGFNPLFNYLII